MSDNTKLVIEIPKDIYARCKEYKLWSYDAETLEGAVATSKPLSEIKAEIEKKCNRINSIANFLKCPLHLHSEIQELLCEILASIDKAESIDPNDMTCMFEGVAEVPNDAFKGWTAEEMLEQIRAESEGK